MLKVEVIGNIGNDAEVKNINGNECVAFNVASSEKRNGTEYTTWVSVLMNGNGGNLTQYLKRGAKVFVRGNLSVKQYQGNNGQWNVGINVSASEVQLCGLKSENTAPAGNNDPFGGQPGGYNPTF